MPIYDYKCSSCDHEIELIQKMSDSPATQCPSCSKETLKKKVSAPSFRLSGNGWYETDFKEGKKKNVVKQDKEKSNPPVCASNKCAVK
ncbi:MAG: zinc ribbon domain-containing protein [Thiotrichaceae bacterium]|nr:zinc ribbon domain-containing protein [Thiotrichaceae bacterium]